MTDENSWPNAVVASVASRRRMANEKFWRTIKSKHHQEDQLDFSKSVFDGAYNPITVVCAKHGEFTTKPHYLLKGSGCIFCGKERVAKAVKIRRLGVEGFIARAREIHGDRYEYPFDQDYQSNKDKVRIICKVHGPFVQKVNGHLTGKGCLQCRDAESTIRFKRAMRETKAGILNRLESKKKKLTYDTSTYEGMHNPMRVTCLLHGDFYPTPANLLKGTGCPGCVGHQSNGERAVASFISIFTPVITRDRTILRPKELDIYLPEHNLAIEYCGEYWHSLKNEEQVREGRLKHYQKYMDCKAKGIRLITIYESEWLDRGHQIRRLLRNAIGKSRGKLMARKCELRNVDSREAKDFYDRYHPQGGSGQGQHYGLYWKGKLVACMRFALGTNDRGNTKERVWTLARYATRITVSGAASRLFKAFLKYVQPPLVKSFSDNRYFDGAMYEALGFSLEAHVNADYVVWSPKLGLRPKSHYQRRELQKRLTDHGLSEVYDHEADPRTETEMTFLMGAGRLYDCGKRRWVYTDPNNKP
jgi:ribosomal protein S17E